MTIEEKIMKLPENPTVAQTAEALGIGAQNLRIGLQRGIYPFGSAVKQEGKHWTKYNIFKPLLIRYIRGDLFVAMANQRPMLVVKERRQEILESMMEG